MTEERRLLPRRARAEAHAGAAGQVNAGRRGARRLGRPGPPGPGASTGVRANLPRLGGSVRPVHLTTSRPLRNSTISQRRLEQGRARAAKSEAD